MRQLPPGPRGSSLSGLLGRIGFGLAAVVAIGIAAVLLSATLVVGLVVGTVVVAVGWAVLRWQFWRAGMRWPPWRVMQPGEGRPTGSSSDRTSADSARGKNAQRGSPTIIDMDLREVEPVRRSREAEADRER